MVHSPKYVMGDVEARSKRGRVEPRHHVTAELHEGAGFARPEARLEPVDVHREALLVVDVRKRSHVPSLPERTGRTTGLAPDYPPGMVRVS